MQEILAAPDVVNVKVMEDIPGSSLTRIVKDKWSSPSLGHYFERAYCYQNPVNSPAWGALGQIIEAVGVI